MADGPRLVCYQQAIQLAVKQFFEETDAAFLDSFAQLGDGEGLAVTGSRLTELREQFIQLVSPSAVQEALLLLEAFGVKEKLKYLDDLCERQPPLVDGRRHLAPSVHSPMRVFRALRLREKEQARDELRALVSETEYRVQQMEGEVEDMRCQLQRLTRTSQSALEEVDRALRALDEVAAGAA
jgi:hypothetical protein